MRNFIENDFKYDVKIFKINTEFYEIRKLNSAKEIINHLIDSHKSNFEIEENQFSISNHEIDDLNITSYVYNEPEKESYWKQFLPTEITNNHNFEIKRISFVLFVSISDKIYSLVGGGGISVVKKYLNHTFGIDIYECLADLDHDQISSITLRNIAGKLTEERDIFRNGQNLADSINFTDIPRKINLELRKELKETIFNFIDFSNDKTLIEVSTYFFIKQKVNFETFVELIKVLTNLEDNKLHTPISSFVKEKDETLISAEYEKILHNEIYDIMIDLYGPNRQNTTRRFDIDFIHPSKIIEFYECDTYKVYAKKKRNCFFETNDKYLLFEKTLEYIYSQLGDKLESIYDFNSILFGIKVIGYKNEKKQTIAPFLQHITCEIKYNNYPIFKIDNLWYRVKDNFIETINSKTIGLLDNNSIPHNILTYKWESKETEGEYNLKYENLEKYIVLDKMISQNIELCDIIYEDKENVYLIHVKKGFDAKMRDLSNQISIAANRLYTDVNSEDKIYLKSVFKRYDNHKITENEFLKIFEKNIVFVMAYKSGFGEETTITDRVKKSKSNIAKYCIIQTNQEMKNLYSLKYYDIK
ncbi:DUF6119 family protein [Wenyingzhuangia marina]|uniref:Sporadically distributed protein, TIGR04141 family n=1 Tax=Wenyingzhuangia marina TaxID=1195760 RepID=A0A1M5V784_9FLAO|nr:DUF6119 family protein [Wenyingzhuangia marina]GGF73938.1 hypothetical protein GCM10011397_16080 [Wenyingzhuangia marina]SHH71085.1 hypothetical protein SAMN05444281_1570 [Wenyingzhuangia marina]